jgi:hypothetical protein
MKRKSFLAAATACLLAATIIATPPARAQSEASALSAVSALPVASVVSAAGAVVAVPAMLSVAGAVLVVKVVDVSARGIFCVLERASDGARVSLEIAAGSLAAASLVPGALVAVSVIGAGTVLSVAGEAIAFIPNRIGKALLHNERLTY